VVVPAPHPRARPLSAELQQIYHSLAAARAGEPPVDVTRGGEQGASDDDVIDADFTVS
jgi:hypothetical protein